MLMKYFSVSFISSYSHSMTFESLNTAAAVKIEPKHLRKVRLPAKRYGDTCLNLLKRLK